MKEKRVILSILLVTLLHIGDGCQIDNHLSWTVPLQQTIEDIFEGVVLRRNTTDIEDVIDVTYGQGTIGGPYFDLTIEDSQFVIRTNAAFKNYEEIEVATRVSISDVEFRCSDGSTRQLIGVWVDITDTNNNYPQFIPPDDLEFVVTPPLPPGFLVTGCYGITVRDIDLTTQWINFTIEDNPYFQIEYDEAPSAVPKEFKAILRTKTLVRSLNEPVVLTITATDVDLTNDPPLSNTTTVRIVSDTEFQFPEEPKFGQTFYLSNYTQEHQLSLFETISLQQGFDEYVNFNLEGGYASYFDLSSDGNQVLIVVETQLPNEVWSERQIFLIVKATREFTSGDSTTLIVQLPEEVALQFEKVYYEGAIIDNGLQLSPLALSQGYDGVIVSAEVVGEYSDYFTANVQGDLVTLAMTPLIDDVIDNNSFISVQVVATSDRSTASTVVNLAIIKDDNVTPVFDKLIYNGTYDPVTGLTAERISYVRGFDETVTADLIGDYTNYFQIDTNGPIITLTSLTIPHELFDQQSILLSIQANKPRTVGANAAIHISLPAARVLEFDESTYNGTIEGNMLSLETILLQRGYEEGVSFDLNGEYATYFTTRNVQNRVDILLSSDLPDTVITQNNVIVLTLTASGLNAISTSTSVLLEIIKDDTTTPVFTRNIYYGTYSGAAFDIEAISLAQGFDTGVSFRIDGAHAQYFKIDNDNGNNVVITVHSAIPEDVIFNEKFLFFNVLADKALSVGANAAVLIRFPTELTDPAVMRFSKNTYVGTLEENEIRLENIILETGFATGTEFLISGDYADHFTLSNTDNVVQISSLSILSNEVIKENDFILLEIEARRPRAVSVWTSVVFEIVKPEIIAPVFGQAYYTGSYTKDTGLTFEEVINLSEGYDETVSFELSGESATSFLLDQENNSISLVLNTSIPIEILGNNNQLLLIIVANKPNSISGRAVISIDLPKDFTDSSFRFLQDVYKGNIEESNLTLSEIILGDYTSDITYNFTGDYAGYFQLNNQNGTFTLNLEDPLPSDVLEETSLFIFTIEVQNANKRTHTVIILENIRTNKILEFEEPFYIGVYSKSEHLQFSEEIRLATEIDQLVEFALEGENTEWFDLDPKENSVLLKLTTPIPAAVLANNHQLVFIVTAQSPGSVTARATVVISLIDEFPEESHILRFDRVTYLGSIANNQAAIPAITLSEGFTQGVHFTLHGELASYFSLSPQEAIVTIALQTAIPEQLIPANRIIVLEIQAAAPQAITAYATIVIEYIVDDDVSPVVELIFAQTFYSGSYASATGLSFPTPISLSQGYASNVEFDLEGDNAQYFSLDRNENSVSVTLTNTIPAAVLANNQQLVFVVTAQSPNSATARATVTISLIDEFPEESYILGFDRVTYLGSIANNQAAIPAITLSEGFTQGVHFTLYGELASYFSLSPQEAIVTIALQTAIPEQLIPANRIIVLEIQAAAPQAITAYATIVIEYIVDDDVSPVVELIFAQTFYSGSYASATGLSFPTPISLSQGYASNVEFDLEGDNAQYFSLDRNENSVSVTLTNTIPAAVLANNQQLVFVVTAQSPNSATARATVTISLIDEFPEESYILGFDRVTYLGSIANNQAAIPAITLSEGFTQGVHFTLYGELASYFSLSPQEAIVTIALQTAIPEQLIPANRIIVLEIQAAAPQAIAAYATIVIEYIVDDDVSPVVELIFAQTFYSGSHASATGLSFPTPISLSQGYASNVEFDLEGDNAQYFSLDRNENSVSVTLTNTIPAAVLANNQQLVFVVTAQSPNSATARATVTISLIDEFPEESYILGFDRVTYLGSIANNQAAIPAITLSEGFTQGVHFTLYGELASYFSLSPQEAIVTIALQTAIPEQLIPANRIIVLEIQAAAPQAITAYATIVIEYIVDDDVSPVVELIFAQTFYSGSYASATGLAFPTPISLSQGYASNVEFDLEGDNAQYFSLDRNENSVSVTLTNTIPAAVLANNQQLVFVVTAQSPNSATARATVTISLIDEFPEESYILGFDRVTYLGSIANNQAAIPAITLSEGFTQGVHFTLYGELASYFSLSPQEAIVTIALQTAIPEQLIPANRIIVLEIQAAAPQAITAYATIVIEYIVDDDVSPVVELIFAQTFYSGSYASATGLAFPTPISLSQGYASNVEFDLEGDNAQYFSLDRNENSVSVTLTNTIPAAVLANNQQLVFVVTAQSPNSATARAIVTISLIDDSQSGSGVTFKKVLFEGIVQNSVVNHETITITGFSDSNVELYGEYSTLFVAELSNGEVTITKSGSLPLPTNTSHVALELRAGTASAVLLLDVVQTDAPTLPTVTFSSPSYAVRVEITHIGQVGQVQASADNGEAVTYFLQLNNAHLQERLSINDEGELYLSAPVNTGVYTFNVVATTVFTQTQGTATVHLSVEAVTVCGGELVIPPLIVLDVDEEEPHYDLINGTQYDYCQFTLTNRWPLNQTWVYVDETGLHTTKIDREHELIAFMPVSQVQVEIILHCQGDSTRVKRSLISDALDAYDYGSNKWILTDTIFFNSRRSLVNVIVNDINDNAPIFVGIENEPIAVGYPAPELAEQVLPRSLAELQATDADIGENAALVYWSSAPQLAVAPTTGFVHLRDGAVLENGARLTVHATDRNGNVDEGLTGSIDILVQLLNESYIAVVTVKDAFLDDEKTVLSHLSEAVGYEVKALRSVVISDEVQDEIDSRKKRDVTSPAGASLQLHIYGLVARQPVHVDQLTADISSTVIAPVIVASAVSLQDHLEGQEICVIAGRDTGLLVATIVLSVLLFIVLVLIAVWFFLRWRKNRNYNEFSDENSLASRNESVDKTPKSELLSKPRLDIAELKKSERRLQEMLDAPIQEISVEPTSSRNDAILEMLTPAPITPIVIQSIDKLKDAADESSEDEFGERAPKRKSVVTFNENVEKIIHVEDTPDLDLSANPDYEVYKL